MKKKQERKRKRERKITYTTTSTIYKINKTMRKLRERNDYNKITKEKRWKKRIME